MPSNYFILVDVSTNPCELAVVDQAVITPGTDPYDAGGTAGTFTIKDSAAFNVIQLTAKRQGPLKYSVTIQPGSGADTANFILSQDGDVLETFSFSTAAGDNQVNSLIAAAADSAFVTLTKIADSTNAIEAIADKPIQPGTPPNGYSVAAYSAAFEALEPYRWNVLSIDTSDPSVQMMMQMYLNRIYQGGKFVMGVIGEDRTVPFEMRLRRASAYNDYKIIYVGTGFYDIAGNVYEGWMAAARIAGLIAGTPSNESITHLPITGAVDMTEPLTNYWYEQAIKAGMLTFSTSAANTVWVEYGINSLVMTGTKEDAGWKKIKRAKVRFELFQRLNDTVEGLVGRLNNDPDGRMTVIQSGNGVCKAMIAERKLLAGAHLELDGNNKPKGDSAWFLVYADDIDALEKMYFAFKFRFAPSDYEITE